MAEYYVEFKDAVGNSHGDKYFNEPTDAAALTKGQNLLTAEHRGNKRVTVATVYQRTVVSQRANEVGELKV
ncbi:hypothetical protein LO772_24510 [Yinghuangia sp. ASG 101]|uniref:hypothetical protein n=1 Tax=Yinghuangia sp. ASG 101 TaxID=2896848 RepID=UPI001E4EBE2B|nr:hypothetical protein [Yinghuangia sp. ASG 101]UGQ10032.1 hypothetical protein LO772_24510 [Yinghuangia sp. ASG 101]